MSFGNIHTPQQNHKSSQVCRGMIFHLAPPFPRSTLLKSMEIQGQKYEKHKKAKINWIRIVPLLTIASNLQRQKKKNNNKKKRTNPCCYNQRPQNKVQANAEA